MRIAVGMSAGVDSSTVVSLLKSQGHDVIGVTMKMYKDDYTYTSCCYSPENKANIEACQKMCCDLNIPYHVIDVSDEFQEYVLNYIRDSYKSGSTPNPCIRCNSNIKFGFFIERIHELGLNIDKFATGHYAQIVEYNGIYYLKSNETNKDQVYFLYRVSQEVLSKTLFPLGNITKDETRNLARSFGLTVADKKDSQDFGAISDIVESTPGDIIFNGEIVGKHNGITNYTIGQRKGLKTRVNIPLFVQRIDPLNNQIIVSDDKNLLEDVCIIRDIILHPSDWIDGVITAKIRSNSRPVEVNSIVALEGGGASVIFSEKQRGIAPGQSLVFYKNGYVIGGGVIEA